MSEFVELGGYIVSGEPLVYPDNTTMTGDGTVESPFGVKSTDLFVQNPLFTGTSGASAYIGWNNETVLWEGNCTGISSVNLSEPLTNFEYGKVIYCPYTANNQVPYNIHEFVTDDSRLIIGLSNYSTDFRLNIFKTRFSASNTTFYSLSNAYFDGTWNSANHNNFLGFYKVIGVNRKV